MERKFFNLLDSNTFTNQTEFEQKTVLIELQIYQKVENTLYDLNLYDNQNWRGSTKYPYFLGQSFNFNGVGYYLNIDFFNEVFTECIEYIKNKHFPLIEASIETLKMQIDYLDGEAIKQHFINQQIAYSDALGDKLIQEFHKVGIDNEIQHFKIIERYLAVNWYDLSDYICGLDNISNYAIVIAYCKFTRLKMLLHFWSSVNLEDTSIQDINLKFSRPKFIAMLNELGFFKMATVQDLTYDQKAQLVLALLQQDYDNLNITHNVSKNIQTLNHKSNLNNSKFTAWTHMESVAKICDKIKRNY